MDLGLQGKTALVTGASKGIGLAIAKVLRREGCSLVLVSRSIDEVEVVEKLKGHGDGEVQVVQADLSQPEVAPELARDFPHIDILVNNAGAVPMGTIETVSDERWRTAWDLKVYGYINMCRSYYPLMRKRQSGNIVNIAGIGAVMKSAGSVCVSAGNAAIVSISQALASASHLDGVRINVLNPGPVATERFEETRRAPGNKSFSDLSKLPFARPAHSVEIAELVAFLVSDRSAYTSGAVINIDGGMSSGMA